MCVFCTAASTGALVGLMATAPLMPITQLTSANGQTTLGRQLDGIRTLSDDRELIKAPQIKEPQWLSDQKAAERAAAAAKKTAGQSTVTYDVATKGAVGANLAEFKLQANQTLNDSRGWSRMGVVFKEVATGGQFTLVLSEASQLPTFSSGCDSQYSCRAGRYVVINQDRWLGATTSWNAAGGALRDYRHMVINHETGHWLGHGHQSCGGPGQAAPVMQQQSINLQGCSFNPWPLTSELWSTQLGIVRS